MSEKKALARGEDGRFIKGVSGNPSGRPALPEEVRDMIKGATPEAVQFIIDTMNDDKSKTETRVRCAEVLIERALGKAVTPIIAEANMTAYLDMTEFSVEELRRMVMLDDEKADDSASGAE